MPRQARLKSESGIYHVMLRGINQQLIFEDEEDNDKFLEVLKDCKAISGYKLYAYCLMGNHVHLLIKVENEELQQIFKRIGARYVYWYNWKYQRKGHLFQDRFRSEPIEDEKYFLTVLRYIHQNPIKSGISNAVHEYQYSSYNEYLNEPSTLIDTKFVLEMMNIKQFVEFNSEDNNDTCLEYNESYRLTDKDALKIIAKISKCKCVAELQELEVKTRDKYIKKFKEKGLSIRQISRLTGVSKGIVERI